LISKNIKLNTTVMSIQLPLNEPLFPIRTAAKLLNISVHTLRMYEKEGLIIPFKKNPVIGYTQKQILTGWNALDQQ
jgi:hypothetical protein